jgi:hypothetical protein
MIPKDLEICLMVTQMGGHSPCLPFFEREFAIGIESVTYIISSWRSTIDLFGPPIDTSLLRQADTSNATSRLVIRT